MRVAVVAFVLVAAIGSANARNAVGYVGGVKKTLKLTAVNGTAVEIRTAAAFRAMAKAARKRGVQLSIASGFRSHAEQTKLYKQYRRGRGNLAARPGFSNHQSGRALDIYLRNQKALVWLEANAAKFGFHRTVPGEPWHWEFNGAERALARPSHHRRTRKTS